jgi:ORF6N domain
MSKKVIQHKMAEHTVINKIYLIRGKKVMLDRDLAEMYGVETRILIQAVTRNLERFPADFMFQLSSSEFKNLISQIEISSWGGTRKMPYAFTEEGVAMLSSVLKSKQAIAVNIQIIRVFSRIRETLLTHKDILLKLEQIEKQGSKHDKDIQNIFEVLRELLNEPEKPRKKVGYKHYDDK